MNKHSTIIEIVDGKNTQPAALTTLFRGLKNGRYLIEPKRKNKRSLQQNRYYWGVVVQLICDRMNELGNDVTPEQAHDFLKDRFNSKVVIGDGGEMLGSVGMSTADMNKEQFGEYLDKIIPWAQNVLDIEIPMPNTQLTAFS